MSDSNTTGLKFAMMVVSALLGILTTICIIFATMIMGNADAMNKKQESLDKSIALLTQTVNILKEDKTVSEGQQRQISKQWSWSGKLHDEVNRMRFAEGLKPIERPSN